MPVCFLLKKKMESKKYIEKKTVSSGDSENSLSN